MTNFSELTKFFPDFFFPDKVYNVIRDFKKHFHGVYIRHKGLKGLKYFAPKIWNIVLIDIRNSDSLSEFATKIKS